MWVCSCGLHNIAANAKCADQKCKNARPIDYDSDEVTEWIKRQPFNLEFTTMSESNEEMYARFYNRDRVTVRGMTDNEIILWQEELAAIAREAKAGYNAAEDEKRERRAKNSAGKTWLLSNESPDPNITEKLTKVRAERTNKADKLRQDMLKYMDEESVNKLMKNVVINGKTADRRTSVVFNGIDARGRDKFKVVDKPLSDVEYKKHQEAIADAALQQAEQEKESHVAQTRTETVTQTSNEVKPLINPFKK